MEWRGPVGVYGAAKLYIVINFSTLFCPQKNQQKIALS